MRCLVCLWWAFQHSRLCFITASISSMLPSPHVIVIKAGTRSTYRLLLIPSVAPIPRRWICLVRFFSSFFLKWLHLCTFTTTFMSASLHIMCVCCDRFQKFSVHLGKWHTSIHWQLQETLQLSLHIQHSGQPFSSTPQTWTVLRQTSIKSSGFSCVLLSITG